MNAIDLDGRAGIVTGGAQGIGRAVAERLIASGARVAILDRDAALAEATAAEIGATAISADVADWDSVAAAVDAAHKALGSLDIAVFSAGIAGANATVADYPVEEWRRVIDIDLTGIFHCCKAVIPAMRAQDYGRIVNIASVAGKEGNPNAGAYSAAKAGVIALTKSLGKENADLDISVNCVTPAAARTAIFDQITQEHIDYMLSKIPRGRFLEVSEAAAMIAWMCSAECGFTTGATFDLSGGRATY
ncbi:SDR family oxidoreductase [Rhodobacteraceae bacterium 2CG4]|uniref:SDR family oxidoreductase n=1 Tax=Halovulum marinum TaxID=2662447 RepID=A0A6L5YX37_9RHOB|nr:SDR family NAD(P)-dependent oxidoreductase [Halovulum marinum]MSU88768.1 SDR family oxidoreductase [Halovulum marinum]